MTAVRFCCCWLLLGVCTVTHAQRWVKGTVADVFSNEPVPFASVRLKSGGGKLADSAGHFLLPLSGTDSIFISSVGYAEYKASLKPSGTDTLFLTALMIAGEYNVEAVVKVKSNPGLAMWRRIVRAKPYNDRYRFQNFGYELYNKLELDLKNINKDRFKNIPLLRKYGFVLDNIDTTEGPPFLPVYITEAVSNYYYQKNPVRRREVFKAVKTEGVNNESIRKFLGGTDQVVNIYANFIPVFDKQFVSPISNNGDEYYNYKIADTQWVAHRRLIHFLFTPKHKGQQTFEGDCWVQDSTWAVQKMTLRVGKDANVNFLNALTLVQEYKFINDSVWFLAKDKFVADVSLAGKNNLSFIGRKTTTYQNIKINDTGVSAALARNRLAEEVHVPETAAAVPDSMWSTLRHEGLSLREAGIYKMIDTLLEMPSFKRLTTALNFIGTGYLDVGGVQIGPWQNWIFSNAVEGLRLRFDAATNGKFSRTVQLSGYGAYGFGDGRWKGEASVLWLLKRSPRTSLYATYMNDYDYGQNYYDEFSQDNLFALAARKGGVPLKFIRMQDARVELYKEWQSGFSIQTSLRQRSYEPVQNLPAKTFFNKPHSDPLKATEASLRLRYAYLERFLENTFYRSSLGSIYPIVELRYTSGISGILRSGYHYHKLYASVSNTKKIAPFGSLYYNVFGGRTWGTLPFPFLDIAPGNEIYYYNRYAFNLINRFEYIHDRYAGFNVEHNFGPGLFRFTPITRKLKWRQFWTAKGLVGNLSEKNKALNFVDNAPFRSLNGQPHIEVSTGVDNILRLLRVDFVWRLSPQRVPDLPLNPSMHFGVFGSFRVSF